MRQRGRIEPPVMSDIELLAAILGGADACATARRLLARFGGLRPLLETDPDRFTGLKGVGEARAAMLMALPEFARRYFSEALPPGKSIRCPADTRDFLHARIRHLEHEIFCCLYLDNRHRVLRFDELFRGTIDGTSVYPREVVKEALAVNAAAVILAHNHPSGVAEPSQADERITKRIKSALDLVDIRLLDHFVVCCKQVAIPLCECRQRAAPRRL
jgi:DNA repair protein RadC